MIPNSGAREIESNGVEKTSKFGISLNDEAAIIQILRDTIYTDKVLAVLREYSANAWDAHREIGKFDVPIKVTLPTAQNPILYIQDFGPGISPGDIETVYTKYGASTKRNSDVAVGMLGIGSKSGFAYSDSFTITSRHNGKCRIYVALLDESDLGTMNLLSEEDCELADTGITIQIPIRTEDIWEFHKKARNLFQYFRPHPEINISLPPPTDEKTLINGTITESDSEEGGVKGWVAVMGCVPYRINIEQLTGPAADELQHYLNNLSGSLNFKIGEVQISASREELKYSKKTKEALIERFNALIEEYVLHTMDMLLKSGSKIWEKRVRINMLSNMGLPIPKEHRHLADESIDLIKADGTEFKTFKTHNGHHGHGVQKISVSSRTRFVIKNDMRLLAGFELAKGDYVIEPIETPYTRQILEAVQIELGEVIEKSGIDGISVINISTLDWVAPARKTKSGKIYKAPDPKHKAAAFILNNFNPRANKKSSNWDTSQHTCTPKDVFVILKRFDIEGSVTLYNMREDRDLIKSMGGTFPDIYGYKTTTKKPLTKDICIGVHYEDWRLPYIKALVTPKIKNQLSLYRWSDKACSSYWFGKKHHAALVKELGEKHIISQLARKSIVARKGLKKFKQDLREMLGKLNDIITEDALEADKALEAVLVRYPVLAHNDVGLDSLWTLHTSDSYDDDQTDTKIWFDYVKMVDKYEVFLNEEAKVRSNEGLDHGHPRGEDLQRSGGNPELCGTEESHQGREMGGRSEALDGVGNNAEVVKQDVRYNEQYCDLQRSEPSGQHHQESIGNGDDGRGFEQHLTVLGEASEEPVITLSDSVVVVPSTLRDSIN